MSNISGIPSFGGPSVAAPISGGQLTPDGMMLYCASQLRFLDEGIQQHMAQQQQAHTVATRLNDLKAALGKSLMSDNDGAVKAQAVAAFQAAYASLPPGDTEMRDKLNATFQDFVADAYCIDDHAAAGHYNLATLSQGDVDALNNAAAASGPLNKVSGDDLKRYSTDVDGLSTDLGKGAELDMINLQSLVSQRQMAIQLTTQIVSKLNEAASTVVNQIGK